MPQPQRIKDLKIWSKSTDLELVVAASRQFFKATEKFDRASQIRRAAVSVPANTAERSGRWSPRDLCRFLTIAGGSLERVRDPLPYCGTTRLRPTSSPSACSRCN